ncbi:hypothetical protein H310_05294 [Aphanomyces invadans]|uniref:Uncharacterized protein n=1 Tax=Aphanomyces invadans TaxID=157072 RepID=A0A024U953_9STRA|nr:hypothetical protein H310_05294 [Aphanomyces invadans]ETW02809.1 hypothetical protein H310_05294 [Aphanomyces invadans]RHY25228.1 hypothetical protein DYB32_008445 [Aphanomyces invadans]|eukprot:XP_008868193.1 hypothetical protein H310_05294 [Aphanomyces invadans]
MQTWKESFEDKHMLKQFMAMHELAGGPKGLDDNAPEAELRNIVEMPKNGIEVDITNLFYGIHMEMKDDGVTNRVVKFIAKCDKRIDVRMMKAHFDCPDMRTNIFILQIDHMSPEVVRDVCELELDLAWHTTEFDWAAIRKPIMLHEEVQCFYSTYGAGRKKKRPCQGEEHAQGQSLAT